MINNILLFVFVSLVVPKYSSGTFIVSFQSNGTLSTKEWVEYKDKLPIMREFTACHWERLMYFATDYTAVWGYCKQSSKNDTSIKCTQFYHRGDPSTMNRQIKVYGWIGGKKETSVKIETYLHRAWNHFCWQYSSLTGNSTFYYNGQLAGVVHTTETSLTGLDDAEFEGALIIGQEQDGMRGRYELSQIFSGDFSGLNIWNYSLEPEKIWNISKCKDLKSGNIVSWEKDKYLINEAILNDNIDPQIFCKHLPEFALFPQIETLENAKTVCAAHGGRIVSPQNVAENNQIMNILTNHGSHCLSMESALQKGRAIWLGFERLNNSWFITQDDEPIRKASYGNWDRFTPVYPNLGCTFLQTDGYWGFRDKTSCDGLELCTVCMFETTPVISLKGELCNLYSPFDWNYYFSINASYQIDKLVGYKSSVISRTNRWSLEAESANIILYKDGNPLGRQIWDWYNRRCSKSGRSKKILTLSTCEFGIEFTCEPGRCISMSKRCDRKTDCKDGSDEKKCDTIRIPKGYNKVQAPENAKSHLHPLEISTKLNILHVDMINTAKMLIELTVEITMRWSDSRLTFANLNPRNKNPVPQRIVDQLWLPLENTIQENAIIGKIYPDDVRRVFVIPSTEPISLNPLEMFEDNIYTGSENPLEISQRFRVEYDCLFKLEKFPFDRQRCNISLKMRLNYNNSMSLVQDTFPILYEGEAKVGQFYIKNLSVMAITNAVETRFIGIIDLDRIFNNQITSSFIPTLLLWLLAYSTLFVGIEQFNVRFMGTVTSLLVLSSLLNSISKSLPTTSYFKYIDLWFLWYLANIFSMVLYHVFANNKESNKKADTLLRQQGKVLIVSEVFSNVEKDTSKVLHGLTQDEDKSTFNKQKSICMNAIVLFPAQIMCFNAIYFVLTNNLLPSEE